MHESGFAKRYIKPGNIQVFLRGPSWWVNIAGFGISKWVSASTALRTTEIGTGGGTASEIFGLYYPDAFDETVLEADEVAHGALAYTPARRGLWALGKITYRMLTHKLAFIIKRRPWAYVTKGTPFSLNELENAGASIRRMNFVQGTMAAPPKNRLTVTDAMH